MGSYMINYKLRMGSVKAELKKLALELAGEGCTVYFSKNNTLHYFKCYKDGKSITVGFAEVPYRWYLSYDIKPSIKKGSSCRILEVPYENEITIFNVEEVLSQMKKHWRKIELKQLDLEYSFLEKIEPKI